MKITKDEATILGVALNKAKHEIFDMIHDKNVFNAIEDLESKLYVFGDDKRRNGRKSHNDFNDILRRFSKKSKKNTNNGKE
jgi:hypothetical protein